MHSINAFGAISMSNVEQMFVRVVESGSFKKAAEYLKLEPSSVSRQIAALENRLGQVAASFHATDYCD